MKLAAALALLAACGRLGFEPVRSDSQRSDTSVADAETFFDASSACGAVPFNDGFDDGVSGSAWTTYADTNVMVTEAAGLLSISPSTVPPSYGWYVSACTADNRDRVASVRVGGVPSSADGVQMYLMIDVDMMNTIGMQFQMDRLFAFRRTAGVYADIFNAAFDPVAHRHWRVGGEAGNVVWETSADGVAWTRHASEAAMIDLSSTRYRLAVGTYMNNPAPGTGSFESFAVR